jgi:hypothetical protein
LAKSLDYLPVKVVQMDDGAVYTIELQSFQKVVATLVVALTAKTI